MEFAEKVTTNIPNLHLPPMQLIITVVLCGAIAYGIIWLAKALGGAAVGILGKMSWLVGALLLGFGIWLYYTMK